MLKTKILVTIGPASNNVELVESFLREGVVGFRINFSHGDKNTWTQYIRVINEASEKIGCYPAIIGDLPGPQIRIGDFREFSVSRGDKVRIVYSDRVEEEKIIPLPSKKVFEVVEVGDVILLDDGRLRLHVEEVGSDYIELTALNDGVVYPRKTILVAGKDIPLPTLTHKDVEAIKYAIENKFTYLALSYTRNKRDVQTLRNLLNKLDAGNIGVIAKIETKSAVNNLSEIASASDAILIARGDLGMHYSLEEIPRLQKYIARESIRHGKPVIIATQLLESMVNSPQPTRSEVVDVMNAVHDFIDSILLTNETAIGKYPIEAIRWLKKIVREAEKWIMEENIVPRVRREEPSSPRDRFAKGLVFLAESIEAKILVYTRTGSMPLRISKYRPQIPVYTGTHSETIARKLQINYSLIPIVLEKASEKTDYEKGLQLLYSKLLDENELEYGDTVILSYGPRETVLHVIKIIQVI